MGHICLGSWGSAGGSPFALLVLACFPHALQLPGARVFRPPWGPAPSGEKIISWEYGVFVFRSMGLRVGGDFESPSAGQFLLGLGSSFLPFGLFPRPRCNMRAGDV
ncbi:hypothetical protein JTE90_016061, partial [Oedothorax gibbosus]